MKGRGRRKNLPKVMLISDIANLIDWRCERIRRILQRRDMCFQMVPGKGNAWYVTAIIMRANMPEVYATLEEEAYKRSYTFQEA